MELYEIEMIEFIKHIKSKFDREIEIKVIDINDNQVFKALRNEVIEAWVSYSGYDLPDYTVTEVQEEE